MIEHVGQDFTTKIKLNLLPGIKLPRGYYQSSIQYLTDTNGTITHHHQSMMTDGKNLEVIVGRDVRSIEFTIYCHNSFPTSPLIYYRYNMRIDRLLMLNIASQFVNLSK